MKKILLGILIALGLSATVAYAAVLQVPQGGTGLGSVPVGKILYGSTSPYTLNALATSSKGSILVSNSSNIPSWLIAGSDGTCLVASSTATSGLTYGSCGGGLSGGTNGFVARWTGASTLGTGVLFDNGTVAGINATSSTANFNIQGTGQNNAFNVASSTGTSMFSIGPRGNLTLSPNGAMGTGNSTSGAILLNSTNTSGFALNIYNSSTTKSSQARITTAPEYTTTVSGAQTITTTSTQITVASTAGFPTSGTLIVHAATSAGENNDTGYIHYTSVDATNFYGTAGVFYKSIHDISLSNGHLVAYNNTTNTYTLLQLTDPQSNGGAVNLKLQSPNPDIEFTANGGYNGTTGQGKFEIDIPAGDGVDNDNTDVLRINGRNDANNSYDYIAVFARPGATGQGKVGIGFQNKDTPTALGAHLHVKNDDFLGDTGAAGLIGQIIQGASGQTADLLQFKNDAGTVLSTFTANGYLGIGTSTPGQQLVVVGDARVTGRLYDSSNSAGSNGNILLSTGSATAWTATSSLGLMPVSTGTTGYVTRWGSPSQLTTGTLLDNGTVAGVNATSSTYTFNIQGTAGVRPLNVTSSTGTSLLTVTQAGNIGIGTTGPASKLEVFTSGEAARFGDNTNTNTYISFAVNPGVTPRSFLGYSSVSGNAVLQGSNGKGIEFNVNNNAFGSGTAMTITSGGNVGIGTTTPLASLQVTTFSSNATTTIEFGKAGQTKGTCMKVYRQDGTLRYMYINTSDALVVTSASCE